MEKTENAYKTRLLTHAIDADGKLVYVDDVPNGNKCGCFCPACKEPLMAKKGEKRRHHLLISQKQNANMLMNRCFIFLQKKRSVRLFCKMKNSTCLLLIHHIANLLTSVSS